MRVDARGNPVPATATSFDCAQAKGFAEAPFPQARYPDRSCDMSCGPTNARR